MRCFIFNVFGDASHFLSSEHHDRTADIIPWERVPVASAAVLCPTVCPTRDYVQYEQVRGEG